MQLNKNKHIAIVKTYIARRRNPVLLTEVVQNIKVQFYILVATPWTKTKSWHAYNNKI